MTTVRDVTYDLLRARGLTTIFGNPGSNELPFLSGLPTDFRYILGLHEGAVLSMADGYSLVTGDTTLINLHAASGSGNAMGALTNSVYSHSPLVVTAGQQVRSTIGQEVMLSNVDAGSLMKPLVKWSSEPTCAEDVPRTMSQAITMAALPAKGPVYVSIPYDDWAADAPTETARLLERDVHSAAALSGEQISSLVGLLESAANPVLVLGPAVDADHANDDAVRLAEKLRVPVWIAPSPCRCPFPTRHPSFRGVLPAGVRDLSSALSGHDLILVVGAPVFRYHQHLPGRYLPEGARLIQVTDDPGEAARAPIGEAFVAPIGNTLAVLASIVEPSDRLPLPQLADFKEPESAGPGLDPEHLFALVRAAAPDDAIYVNESTSTADAFWSQMALAHQGSYYFPASGGLGFGLPAAVGAQLGCPQRQVIGLIGDGSANYGITALWTAARYRIPVVIIILKNGTYGALRGFSKILNTGDTPGLDVPGIDFVNIAQGYGVRGTAVASAADFVTAFKSALAAEVPTLIEVHTHFEKP
ncbi:benzoylformate decarboxylase [Rhodococcus opacus]|uniref:acetolactate synthase n=1 Tax=Rhodococcus opacus TaxID=37919 RepID=A0AAX3YTC1_RHOOP|nr:benzoylformate decarboxylase [Rhodococcus opacus]MCZ4587622.1 benzoylformate decarboxylase [Rhodococcus opacus]WLF51382.1 benzoylformate decarboxylase [Rhodococcus opacus]